MSKISQAAVDASVRTQVFDALNLANTEGYVRINARQYGTIVTDSNGHQRLARIAVIVAEEREDMTAAELLQKEIDAYQATQNKKAAQKAEREAKAKRDAEKRAKIAAEKAAKAAEAAAEK